MENCNKLQWNDTEQCYLIPESEERLAVHAVMTKAGQIVSNIVIAGLPQQVGWGKNYKEVLGTLQQAIQIQTKGLQTASKIEQQLLTRVCNTWVQELSKNDTFSAQMTLKAASKLVGQIGTQAIYQSFTQSPLNMKVEKYRFGKKEIALSGVKQPAKKPVDPDCGDYALFAVGERRAMQPLFGHAKWPKELKNQPRKLFTTWGYQETCNPKPGDLAIFMGRHRNVRIDYNEGNLKHVAVVTENRHIRSKWGEQGPLITGRIDQLPLHHGTKVVFLHKSRGDGLEDKLLGIVRQELPSVLLPLWKKRRLQGQVTACIREKIRGIPKEQKMGPHGRGYFVSIEDHINKRLEKEQTFTDKEHLCSIVQDVFAQVPVYRQANLLP